jgi:hypothetical protein
MPIKLSQSQLILFVLKDDSGVEITGLDDTFSVLITKAGAPFVSGTGAKAEVGSGYYSYELTAGETDTVGPLGLLITGGGAVQNLLYDVSGTVFETPAAGSNILTAAEGAAVLRCDEDDPDMLTLLPLVDAYIRNATGHDWTADVVIYPEAKSAARMLLKKWHEDPGMDSSQAATLAFGLSAALVQLEAIALRFKTFRGRNGPGMCRVAGLYRGDQVQALIGLVGATGSQASKFESAISEHNEIQQLDSEDLSECWFRIEILSPWELP